MQSYKIDNEGNLLITAPVMIPNAKDCDYENGETPLTENQIKEFAESYKKYGFIDHEHGLTRDGRQIGIPVHSFLLKEDTSLQLYDNTHQVYPKGTWLITSKLTDNDAKQVAMQGGYTGYSPSVLPQSKADEYLQALKNNEDVPLPESYKSVNSAGNSLIRDVPNPVVLSVSLVKKPCLHQSKICKLNGEIMEEDITSFKSKILKAMDMAEQADVIALKSEITELHSTIEAMKSEFSETLKTMQDEIKATLEMSLKAEENVESTDETPEEVEETPDEDENEENVETEEIEEIEENEVKAEKGHSKAEPIHDNIQAEKSKPQNIYEFLGRNPDGTRKL